MRPWPQAKGGKPWNWAKLHIKGHYPWMQLGKVSINRLLIALSFRDFYRLFSIIFSIFRVIVHLPNFPEITAFSQI